jgi:hypothetical protein
MPADEAQEALAASDTRNEAWQRVVEATEGHELMTVTTEFQKDSPSTWTYVRCTCGVTGSESWEFTDHIRRIVVDAIFAEEQS